MSTAALIIAHGSPDPGWTRLVEQSIDPCRERLGIPICAAYLGDEGQLSIAAQAKKLEQKGVHTAAIVPLFVSAGSAHIGEIRQRLGLAPPYPLPQFFEPLDCGIQFLWRPPLEDHPLVEKMIVERLASMSADPQRETVLLVGHGSVLPGYRQHWERLLERLSQRVRHHLPFAAVGYATLRPDTVTEQAQKLAEQGTLLVLPLFISSGYFTHQAIPQRLAGIPHRYRGETYVPHPAVGQWIVQSVQSALREIGA